MIRKGAPGGYSYVVNRSFAALSLAVRWRTEIEPNELDGPAKEIFKSSAEGATGFLLDDYSKMQEEKAVEGRTVI